MTTDDPGVSRRSLLAAAGIGAVGIGGFARATSPPVEYNRTTVLDDGPIDLRVDWKEWYNGTALESQDSPTDRDVTAQPLISLNNLMPGDAGKAAFGLTVESDEGNAPPAQLQMRLRRLADSGRENEITEPEEKAGDATPDRGELQDSLEVLLWYDTGISAAGTPIYGHCDGDFDPVVNEKIDEGPLTVVSVPADSQTWVDLDAHPNQSADCLEDGDALCLGFEWVLPNETGNIVQTDSVAFAIEFRAIQCDAG